MSRKRLPRLAVGIALSALAWAPAVLAQSDTRAITVIGSDPHSRRCVTNVMSGDTTDATLQACTRALSYPHLTNAAEAQVLVNRGVVYLRRGESEAALADFDRVVSRDPENAEAQLNRGAALIQLRQHGPAIAAITTALSLGVMEPHKAYFNRGAAREALGDLRGAYEDYSTALEIRPDWGPANAELARFVRNRRDHLANVLEEQPAPTP